MSIVRSCMLIVASALLLAFAASLPAASPAPLPQPQPPCTDPVIMAAARLAQDKQFDRAQSVTAPLLAKSAMAGCAASLTIGIEKARKAAAPGAVKTFANQLGKTGTLLALWVAIILPLAVPLILLGLLVRGASEFRRRRVKAKVRWRVRSIAAGSDAVILGSWKRAMEDAAVRETFNSNLLIQSGLPLPKAVVNGGTINVEAQALIDTAPQVGGLSPAWFVRLTRSLGHACMSPRRTLSLGVTKGEKSVIMRIEATGADGKISPISGAAVWTSDIDAAQEIDKMAAALALKTNYLIADASASDAPQVSLRVYDGIEKLNSYSAGGDIAALREAARIFSEARRLGNDASDAALFEGITYELLEEHDYAQERFALIIASSAAGTVLRVQATYNLGISHLRCYTAPSITDAIALFQQVVDEVAAVTAPDLTAEHRLASRFAQAARANAIAHKFIFESHYPGENPDQWATDATAFIAEAQKGLKDPGAVDDPVTQTQLQWLVSNAAGNLALNQAGADEKATRKTADAIKAMRQDALHAFRECETLVTPGVETLTNIATALLKLHRPTEALDYTRRARALNPRYEYAYLREYEIERARNAPIAALRVLTEANRQLGVIGIPSFRAAYVTEGIAFHER